MKLQSLYESQMTKPSITPAGDTISLEFGAPLLYNHHYARHEGRQVGVLSGYRIESGDTIDITLQKNRDDNYEFEFTIHREGYNGKRVMIEDWEAGDDDIEWIHFALSTVISSLARVIEAPEVEQVKQFFKKQLTLHSK